MSLVWGSLRLGPIIIQVLLLHYHVLIIAGMHILVLAYLKVLCNGHVFLDAYDAL